MGTELPRREGGLIRIPDVITGPNGESGETSRLIGPMAGEWRRWDDYLTSSATITTTSDETEQ